METPKSAAPFRTPPVRDECWSETSTWRLVNAWGNRFVELNRGNLRQQDWRAVVDAVNDAHGGDLKSCRTDVQCKNRLDTLKKKYKAEKARVSENNEKSMWPFYERMDELIGCVLTAKKMETPLVTAKKMETPLARSVFPVGIPLLKCRLEPMVLVPQKRTAPVANDSTFSLTSGPMGIPLLANQKVMGAQPEMMILQKRSAPVVAAPVVAAPVVAAPVVAAPVVAAPVVAAPVVAAPVVAAPVVAAPKLDDSFFRRNYSAVAAAAVAELEDNDDLEDSDSEERCDVDGVSRLARAIDKLGEMYERVEGEKQMKLIELEKQRIQFAEDMEVERMKLFMDTQVQLEKIKQAKGCGPNGEILAFTAIQPFGNF